MEGLLERLRAEAAGAEDATRRARLFYEIGEIEERSGDEPAAARDYLAAFNADATFREPIEGLLRLLERRRSLRNLGKLVDALARGAETPDEEVRAKTLRAYFLEDVGGDVEAAKEAAIEATEVEGASAAEAAMAWLTLELMAARVGDAEARCAALSKRPEFAGDPTWRGLLRLDAARLQAAGGDIDAALELLALARADGAGATFTAAVAAERLARKAPGDPGSHEAQRRTKAFAEALEAQASLIDESITSPSRGDALGVPRWARKPMYMVDAWLRAAEARASAGDDEAAAALLDRAREALARFEGRRLRAARRSPPSIDARIRMAERTGNTAVAAELAEKRLGEIFGGADAEPLEDGSVAAALAMRVAEHAASEGDVPGALQALSRATRSDPVCIPARALQLDLLADDEPATFAAQLEALAEHLPTDGGRGRALLLAAWVWGARAKDPESARHAVAQAAVAGAPDETVARVSRTLASLTGDAIWYEDATRRLLAGEPTEDERPMLWLEIARARFIRGADAEAREALRALGATTQGAWLGRALEAFLPPSEPAATAADVMAARALEALDELALRPQPADVARGLVLMAAMRAHLAGDTDGALRRLRALADGRADDALAATYLAELERSRGALEEVARIAERCAEATEDEELASALRLGSGARPLAPRRSRGSDRLFRGRHRCRTGRRARSPRVGHARRRDVDSLDARRRAIARALDAGGDEPTLLLERFATELAAGDAVEASMALAAVEARRAIPRSASRRPSARAAWRVTDDDPEALDARARAHLRRRRRRASVVRRRGGAQEGPRRRATASGIARRGARAGSRRRRAPRGGRVARLDDGSRQRRGRAGRAPRDRHGGSARSARGDRRQRSAPPRRRDARRESPAPRRRVGRRSPREPRAGAAGVRPSPPPRRPLEPRRRARPRRAGRRRRRSPVGRGSSTATSPRRSSRSSARPSPTPTTSDRGKGSAWQPRRPATRPGARRPAKRWGHAAATTLAPASSGRRPG